MKRLLALIVTAVCVALISIGCSQTEVDNKMTAKDDLISKGYCMPTYQSLNEVQIKKFLDEKNIEPLDMKAIGRQTIILHRHQAYVGVYEVSVGSEGKFSVNHSQYFLNSKIGVEVINATGSAGVIINDPKIRTAASKVKVTFENGYISTENLNGSLGVLVPDKRASEQDSNVESIKIIGEDGTVLYGSN